jgi:hypothetical protein
MQQLDELIGLTVVACSSAFPCPSGRMSDLYKLPLFRLLQFLAWSLTRRVQSNGDVLLPVLQNGDLGSNQLDLSATLLGASPSNYYGTAFNIQYSRQTRMLQLADNSQMSPTAWLFKAYEMMLDSETGGDNAWFGPGASFALTAGNYVLAYYPLLGKILEVLARYSSLIDSWRLVSADANADAVPLRDAIRYLAVELRNCDTRTTRGGTVFEKRAYSTYPIPFVRPMVSFVPISANGSAVSNVIKIVTDIDSFAFGLPVMSSRIFPDRTANEGSRLTIKAVREITTDAVYQGTLERNMYISAVRFNNSWLKFGQMAESQFDTASDFLQDITALSLRDEKDLPLPVTVFTKNTILFGLTDNLTVFEKWKRQVGDRIQEGSELVSVDSTALRTGSLSKFFPEVV